MNLKLTISVLLSTAFMLAGMACSSPSEADVEATAETRLQEKQVKDAAPEATAQAIAKAMVEATAKALPTATPTPALEMFIVEWKTVDDVVSALDKHTLSDKVEKWPQMVFAADGASYEVKPGGYRLEFYVYENKDDITKGVEVLQSFGIEGEVVEKNILLFGGKGIYVPGSTARYPSIDETILERLLADLRD